MQMKTMKFHFIGIGGVGMSGLAELLHNIGASVTGSDLAPSVYTEALSQLGIPMTYQHAKENIGQVDVVVFSSAIDSSNPEIQEAKRRRIPLIQRAEVLAELMRFKRGIAVGGSHGKTTTTSLLASIFLRAKKDPTIVVGGRLNLIKSTSQLGQGEWLIAEADESDRSFLKLSPEIAVVTSIDNDHLDQYDDFDHLKQTFLEFALKIPFYGFAVVCGDDPLICKVFADFPKKIRTYGFQPHNDYHIQQTSSGYLMNFRKEPLGHFQFHLPGHHNVLNACGAIAIAIECGLDIQIVLKAMEEFIGVERRFQCKGDFSGITIYDDYGHHPTEIQCMIQAFKEKWPQRRLVVAFQPHRFSRTQLCWQQFKTCFQGVDELLFFDIYAASEKPIEGLTSEKLFKEIAIENKKYLGHWEKYMDKITNSLSNGDILLTLGAGDISTLSDLLVQKLKTGYKVKDH